MKTFVESIDISKHTRIIRENGKSTLALEEMVNAYIDEQIKNRTKETMLKVMRCLEAMYYEGVPSNDQRIKDVIELIKKEYEL